MPVKKNQLQLLSFALIMWLQICKEWSAPILSFEKPFYYTILPSTGFFWNKNLVQGTYFRAVLSIGAFVLGISVPLIIGKWVKGRRTVQLWQ